MLCTENVDRFCGCVTNPQTVPQNPDKPFLAPSTAQNSNSMKKTVIPGIANWSMSSLIAFRIIPCLLGKPFFTIAKSPFSLMFQDADDEVGGALARANLIAMIHTDHDDRQSVACIRSRPNGRASPCRQRRSGARGDELTLRISSSSYSPDPAGFAFRDFQPEPSVRISRRSHSWHSRVRCNWGWASF